MSAALISNDRIQFSTQTLGQRAEKTTFFEPSIGVTLEQHSVNGVPGADLRDLRRKVKCLTKPSIPNV